MGPVPPGDRNLASRDTCSNLLPWRWKTKFEGRLVALKSDSPQQYRNINISINHHVVQCRNAVVHVSAVTPPSLRLKAQLHQNLLKYHNSHSCWLLPIIRHTQNTKVTKTLCSQYFGKTKWRIGMSAYMSAGRVIWEQQRLASEPPRALGYYTSPLARMASKDYYCSILLCLSFTYCWFEIIGK